MLILILASASVGLLAGAVTIHAVVTAKGGYEDENGFHASPAQQPPASSAIVSRPTGIRPLVPAS